MSYARWTKDCHVYCYQDASGGYTTHVCDKGPPWTYNDPDLRSFWRRLVALKETGLVVPDDLIEEIAEMAEDAEKGSAVC